ncbi:MAG: hypothetical protein IPJ84_09640 [Bdellovibrionales bacterium]|nr:hypothetical protein [Bdellovibrionales bacterium]
MHHRVEQIPTAALLFIMMTSMAAAETTHAASKWPEPAPQSLTELNSPKSPQHSRFAAIGHLAGEIAPAILFQSKDWTLFDTGTSCIASTTATLDTINHRLEVVVDKSLMKPIALQISSDTVTAGRLGFESGKERFTRISAPADLYWNIPRDSEDLIKTLKRDMRFDVVSVESGVPTGRKLAFSLRGSSATITELAKRCAGLSQVPSEQDDDFEKAFLPETLASIDIRKQTPATSDRLKSLYEQALTEYRASLATAAELSALNSRYVKELTELGGLQQNIDRLSQRDLIRLQTEKTNTQSAIQQADQDLLTLRPQLTARETELIQANSDYEAAYRQIQPYIAEHTRLENLVTAEDSRLQNANTRYSDIDSRLATANRDIQSLQSEAQSLRHDLSSAQSDTQRARSDYDRASDELRRFDAPSEIRRRQMSDGRLSSIDREISAFDSRIQAQQNALHQVENERNQLNSALLQCRQTAGADCSREQAALVDAERHFQDARQAIAQLQANRQSKMSERDSLQRQIERDVYEIRDRLAREESNARTRLSETERRTSEIESRLRSITQFDLPNRQNEVSRLQNELSIAASDVRTSQNSLQAARTQLANFRRSTGYESLESNVNLKLSRVNSIKSDISKLDRDIKRREATSRDGRKRLAQIDLEIQNTLDLIKQKQSRSADIQKLLEPYELEKASLLQKKAISDQAFNADRNEYAQLL